LLGFHTGPIGCTNAGPCLVALAGMHACLAGQHEEEDAALKLALEISKQESHMCDPDLDTVLAGKCTFQKQL